MEVCVTNVNDVEQGSVDEELHLYPWVVEEEESDHNENHSSAHEYHAVGDDVFLVSSQAEIEGPNLCLYTRYVKLCPVLIQVVIEYEWA